VNINTPNDNLLASAISKGSIEAFEQLFHRYKRKLYYFSLKYTDDTFDAEELVQTVFINLWEHRKSLDENKSVKNYLYKSAVNLIYNNLKRKAVRRNYIDRELSKPEESVNQTYEQIFCNELEKKIDSILLSLPPQQQKIISFSRFDGLSHEEIAEKLDLSVRTVENQIYRATKVLKKHLETDLISSSDPG
jgi:RNA polymerase sigma-70 factor (ECF subfamily)